MRPRRSEDNDRSSHDRFASKPNAFAFPLNHQSVAIVIDFIKPIIPVRNLGRLCRDQGANADFAMPTDKITARKRNSSL
jgi:hypothetical protein